MAARFAVIRCFTTLTKGSKKLPSNVETIGTVVETLSTVKEIRPKDVIEALGVEPQKAVRKAIKRTVKKSTETKNAGLSSADRIGTNSSIAASETESNAVGSSTAVAQDSSGKSEITSPKTSSKSSGSGAKTLRPKKENEAIGGSTESDANAGSNPSDDPRAFSMKNPNGTESFQIYSDRSGWIQFDSAKSDAQVRKNLAAYKAAAEKMKQGDFNNRAWCHFYARPFDVIAKEIREEEVGCFAPKITGDDSDFPEKIMPKSVLNKRKALDDKSNFFRQFPYTTGRRQPKHATPDKQPKEKRLPKISIDYREYKLLQLAETHGWFTYSRENLEVGDIVIGEEGHEIFVERKTISDFHGSIFDGRLHNQLGNKLRKVGAGARACIILEGFVEDDFRIRTKKKLLLSKLVTMCLRDGIPVFVSRCPAETYQFLYVMAGNYFQKLYQCSPKDYGTDRLVGNQKIRQVQAEFRAAARNRSLETICGMLSMVKGVSEKLAGEVIQLLVVNDLVKKAVTEKIKKSDSAASAKAVSRTNTCERSSPLQIGNGELGTAAERETSGANSNERGTDVDSDPNVESDKWYTDASHQAIKDLTESERTRILETTDFSMNMLINELRRPDAIDRLKPIMNSSTAKSLTKAIAGKNAASLEREKWIAQFGDVKGVSPTNARKLVGKEHQLSHILKAIRREDRTSVLPNRFSRQNCDKLIKNLEKRCGMGKSRKADEDSAESQKRVITAVPSKCASKTKKKDAAMQ